MDFSYIQNEGSIKEQNNIAGTLEQYLSIGTTFDPL
jgi:hypothetical protein